MANTITSQGALRMFYIKKKNRNNSAKCPISSKKQTPLNHLNKQFSDSYDCQ